MRPPPTGPARRLLPALVLALGLTACAGEPDDDEAGPPAPAPSPTVGQRLDETVRAVLGGVELELEVADEPQERATGLMGREQVPAGTGMVFLFDEPVSSSFYMFQVPVPLVAVFVRDGEVVGVEQMDPCAEPDPGACPRYGPGQAYDTVVETAPETLPDVREGDRLELRG